MKKIRKAQFGERHWSSKLTDEDVVNILRLLKNGATQRAIAARYGVHQTAIKDINIGKTWRHISREA